ncbi:hypothetical protein [Aestuariivirga sp.]|uniref:hypothetical protein n=1 Tax=Aestuariivirga sp. TaxID=2650926 RepID=UPI0039E5FA1D
MAGQRLSDEILERLQPCLVLEDNSIVLLDLEQSLIESGFTRLHTVSTIAQAERTVAAHPIRSAILDFRINTATSVEIALRLAETGAVLVFLTGYGAHLNVPKALAHVQILSKPADAAAVIQALAAALGD